VKFTGNKITSFLNSPSNAIIGVLLYGPDRGLVKERGQTLTKAYSHNKESVFGTSVLTSDDLSGDPGKLDDEISALSMFGDARIVRLLLDHERNGQTISKIIKNALSMFGDARIVRLLLDHERNGQTISKIIKKYDNNPKMAEAKLIVEAGELTQKSVIRKTFEASKNFLSIACYSLSTIDVEVLIKTRLKELSISIEKNALQYWAPLIDGDLALINSEIEKMALYMGYGKQGKKNITIENIKEIAAGGNDVTISDVIMNTMSGNLLETDNYFHRAIKSKLNSAVILRGLQNHLVRLIQAKTQVNKGASLESAINSLRPPVFYMHKTNFMKHLRIWTLSALHKALTQSLVVEQNLKTAGAPQEAMVGRLLIALSSYSKRRN